MKSMQQPKLKPRAIDLDGFSSEEEEEEEEEEEDEEELEPEDIELARLEGSLTVSFCLKIYEQVLKKCFRWPLKKCGAMHVALKFEKRECS